MNILGGLLACALALSACGMPNQKSRQSQLNTVEISQTPVESQGKFGLCWAYATVGLVESQYKTKTGRDVNLSEEAIGFYRLAHSLHEMLTTWDYMDIIHLFARPGLINEGWNVRLPAGTTYPASQGDQMDALDLIKTYGAVPESAWNFKITSDAERDQLYAQIRRNGMAFLNGRDMKKVTVEEIITNILVGAFPSRPPAEFDVEGQHVTAQQYVANLQFNPDDYVTVGATNEAEYDRVIAATKRALVRGVSAPLMFPINIDRLHGDLFTSDNLPTNTAGDMISFVLHGGHVVLATDFVNKGGRQGRVSDAELATEFQRPAGDLDYLVVKNSWGIGARTNEAGLPLPQGSTNGYYRMDQSFLRAISKVGGYPGWTFLAVVVPKDIAADPFGTEPIAQLGTTH